MKRDPPFTRVQRQSDIRASATRGERKRVLHPAKIDQQLGELIKGVSDVRQHHLEDFGGQPKHHITNVSLSSTLPLPSNDGRRPITKPNRRFETPTTSQRSMEQEDPFEDEEDEGENAWSSLFSPTLERATSS